MSDALSQLQNLKQFEVMVKRANEALQRITSENRVLKEKLVRIESEHKRMKEELREAKLTLARHERLKSRLVKLSEKLERNLVNEKVEVTIGTRRLIVEIEDLTPIEINALAQKVSERMAELQQQNNKVADTSKIALLVALSFAADLDKEARAHETTRRMVENTTDRLSQSLRESLDAAGPPEGT